MPNEAFENKQNINENAATGNLKATEPHLYEILVDKHPFTKTSPQTVASILALVDKTVDKWHLQLKLHGGQREELDPKVPVDLSRKGIERFETVPKDCANG